MVLTKLNIPPIWAVWSTVDIPSRTWMVRFDSSRLSSSTMVWNIHYWRVTIRGKTTTERPCWTALISAIYINRKNIHCENAAVGMASVTGSVSTGPHRCYCCFAAAILSRYIAGAAAPSPPHPAIKGRGGAIIIANSLSPSVLSIHVYIKLRFSVMLQMKNNFQLI